MFIVTSFISVCFREILVSGSWRWRNNNTETCKLCKEFWT